MTVVSKSTQTFSDDSSTDSGISVSRSPSFSSIEKCHTYFVSGLSKLERSRKTSRDPIIIERRNLVNISKLIVKELLDTSTKYGRMLDSDHMTLQHFFIVLEHVLRHGLRPKKGLLGPKKELWDILQLVEKLTPEANDITSSVRNLPTVKTHMGRARAWLRVALMQKKLADYLKVLIDHKDDVLVDYFEPDALMMSEEAIVIVGLLVGLNVIDCNLCIKEEDLDCELGVIDFSLYLRSNHYSNNSTPNSVDSEYENMTTVLDQKNYIEELNRHLNATVANLQSKVEDLTTNNALMKEDLDIARENILALMQENAFLKAQRCTMQSWQQSEQDKIGSIKCNRNNDGNASNDNDESELEELKQQLMEESRLRRDAEKELNIQICIKAEIEVAMKLLEKDIHEKQDTIISLRKQLEDIKIINLEMYKKLQECEEELTQKAEVVSRLQTKTLQIGQMLNNLQKFNYIVSEPNGVADGGAPSFMRNNPKIGSKPRMNRYSVNSIDAVIGSENVKTEAINFTDDLLLLRRTALANEHDKTRSKVTNKNSTHSEWRKVDNQNGTSSATGCCQEERVKTSGNSVELNSSTKYDVSAGKLESVVEVAAVDNTKDDIDAVNDFDNIQHNEMEDRRTTAQIEARDDNQPLRENADNYEMKSEVVNGRLVNNDYNDYNENNEPTEGDEEIKNSRNESNNDLKNKNNSGEREDATGVENQNNDNNNGIKNEVNTAKVNADIDNKIKNDNNDEKVTNNENEYGEKVERKDNVEKRCGSNENKNVVMEDAKENSNKEYSKKNENEAKEVKIDDKETRLTNNAEDKLNQKFTEANNNIGGTGLVENTDANYE